MIPETSISSFTPQACLYRWQKRQIVDLLFAKAKSNKYSRKQRKVYYEEAVNMWRMAVVESNKL